MSFLALEAATGFLSGGQPESTTQGSVLPILMLLIATEGICGGLAYVNVFYRVGQDSPASLIEVIRYLRKGHDKSRSSGLAVSALQIVGHSGGIANRNADRSRSLSYASSTWQVTL
ncbi:batten disease protein CLN3 [Ceratobasidium sp. AG-Ba]|nr:batten disease protein CLN3 [Ceratobasidium sp. AG-Ba]